MLFNSYLFLFLFLPVVVIGYFAVNKLIKYHNAGHWYLLIASVLFYTYAGVRGIPVILLSIAANYVFGMLLKKNCRFGKLLLAAAVIFNIGILMYFKYYNFFVDSLNLVFRTNFSIRELLLPAGISFITFQQITFLVDMYYGKIEDCSPLRYALFILFFPHVLSGPIITWQDLNPKLQDAERRKLDWDSMASGIYMFVMGLGKKVLLADVFAKAVTWGYANIDELNSVSAILVSLAFTVQIYFDFSGYSDMAVGISKMLRLDLPQNFNSPYKATTIMEFWNRWHMTLTRFLTQYLYIPLGGNRKGKVRTWINTMIVFGCSGFWHGANWTYIFWGMAHGFFMVCSKECKKITQKVPKVIGWFITFAFVNFTWVLFRAESLGTAVKMWTRMFSGGMGKVASGLMECFDNPVLNKILPQEFLVFFYFAVCFFLLIVCKNASEKTENFDYSLRKGILTVCIAAISIMSLSGVSTYVYSFF